MCIGLFCYVHFLEQMVRLSSNFVSSGRQYNDRYWNLCMVLKTIIRCSIDLVVVDLIES